MCFSASASFMTAGVTAVIGTVCLGRVQRAREIPLAATPILFALQQAMEGLLWLELPTAPHGSSSASLALGFLFFADVLWPVYAPMAVLLVEPDERRRRFMALCLLAGLYASGYLLWSLATGPRGALILDGHIVYEVSYKRSALVALAYLAATGLPLVLSSQRMVVILGLIILIGSAVAFAFYWEAFVSVWCFFAAGASAVILSHFELSYRRRLQLARGWSGSRPDGIG
jgi:hypothetical protein